jgi:phosphoglycerate dehydrogenase-like enzyme
LDNIDCAVAAGRGIAVFTADGANARSVAELAIGQLFALARAVPECSASLKRGLWERGRPGVELEGKTLGLIGCGRAGKLVARMAIGIGMQVVAFDPAPDTAFSPGRGFRMASFEEVLAAADFLSLHCPPAADGRPLLDAEAIVRMKRGAFIINTARHNLLDSVAALAALESGHIAGFALDVFDMKRPADLGLSRHPRVIATPHIGAFTRESIDRTMAVAVGNLLTALQRA